MKSCRVTRFIIISGSPKDDLLHRPYLIKKTTDDNKGGRGSKMANFETTYVVYGRPLSIA